MHLKSKPPFYNKSEVIIKRCKIITCAIRTIVEKCNKKILSLKFYIYIQCMKI